MTSARLSALDASFLAVETPTGAHACRLAAVLSAPAEVGCRALLSYAITSSCGSRARRATAKSSRESRFGLHSPEWIDDRNFSVDRHVYRAPGPLSELAMR